MRGMMQDWPLTVDRIIDHGATRHGAREIVSRTPQGPTSRTTYAALRDQAKRVSHGLREFGVRPGDRVATLAWNSARHMEIWYGAMGMGAVCHTLNPRLHPDQLAWMVGHAGDRVIFADLTFAPLLLTRSEAFPSLEAIVLLGDAADRPAGAPASIVMYDEWVADRPSDAAWGGFDEATAAGLCYTSGTTGDPKGVLYSHRSNFLHTLMTIQADVMGLSAADTILAVVPMFHANGWGIPFSAPAVGAKLVFPGARLDGPAVHELIEAEGVTFSAAVPTVWQSLLHHLRLTRGRFSTLKRVVIGGAACPEALIRAFHDDYGVEVLHAWGMTETSPLGTLGAPDSRLAALPFEAQIPWRMKQGRPPLGVELAVLDEAGARLAEDGVTQGRLVVRGPIVTSGYFGASLGSALDAEGYFDTGDIATIDPGGYMQITDRAKDVIKSGGEWISSIEIENVMVGHGKVALAGVIGVAHAKWGERPLLLVQLAAGESATRDEMLAHLEGRIARWWTPDDVVFLDAIPLGPTGKIDKKALRARFADHLTPAAFPA